MISRKPVIELVNNFDFDSAIKELNVKRVELNNFIKDMESEVSQQYIDEIMFLRTTIMTIDFTEENALKLYGWIKNYEDFMEYWHNN